MSSLDGQGFRPVTQRQAALHRGGSDWEEGLMPHRRTMTGSITDAALARGKLREAELDCRMPGGTEAPLCRSDAAEERRLPYLAIIRAGEELTITRAVTRRRYGNLEPRLPSPGTA
jgi:superfamily I DNA/RNA helicase